MKLDWGQSIAIFYGLFMVIMISMVIMASRNQADLVQDNYYQKDLEYESFRKRRQNAAVLPDQVAIEVSKQQLQVRFPENMHGIKGTLTLYRPSDRSLDRELPIDISEGNTMVIDIKKLPGGLWRIMIDWEQAGKEYYQEEILTI